MTPSAWLKDTLEKLSTWPNSGTDELLPLNPAFLEAVKHYKHWPSMRLSWMLTVDSAKSAKTLRILQISSSITSQRPEN